MRVLLVEDHRAQGSRLCEELEAEHFRIDVVSRAAEADSRVRQRPYDVILLNLTVPGIDGLALLRRWRTDHIRTHVLALASGGTESRLRALNSGADDCLSQPFEVEELVARLRALIRRRYWIKDPVIRVHDLEIDTPSRTVRRAGLAIPLTPREYALLEFLAFHQGQVVSRTLILEGLYGEQGKGNSNVVDVYIRYLRTKIDEGFDPPLILTRWGEGYFLRADNAGSPSALSGA
jgi:DNA-binding response OmpR family regulator